MTPAKTNPPLNGTPKMAPHWSRTRTRSPTLNRWNWTVTFLKKKSMDDFLKASGNTGLRHISLCVYLYMYDNISCRIYKDYYVYNHTNHANMHYTPLTSGIHCLHWRVICHQGKSVLLEGHGLLRILHEMAEDCYPKRRIHQKRMGLFPEGEGIT